MKKTTIICDVCQKEVVFEGERPPLMEEIAGKFLIRPEIVIVSKGGNAKKRECRNMFESFKDLSHICTDCALLIYQKIEEALVSVFPKNKLKNKE